MGLKKLKFTKMHGNGNDYIYVDCFRETVSGDEAPELARFLSDRRKGVGSDGLVLIRPSEKADCRMDMYNSDGSRGKMCGNAVRCVGKYIHDRGLARKDVVTVETLMGIRTLELDVIGGTVRSARVDMGEPDFRPSSVPMSFDGPEFIDLPISAGGREFRGSCVTAGSSHIVVYVDDPAVFDVGYYGPLLENNDIFPDRVNVNFARVLEDGSIQSRTWERGSGETMACGSGACSCLVISARLGKTGRKATVRQRGGELLIEWSSNGTIYKTGPAAFVFDGEIEVNV